MPRFWRSCVKQMVHEHPEYLLCVNTQEIFFRANIRQTGGATLCHRTVVTVLSHKEYLQRLRDKETYSGSSELALCASSETHTNR